MISVASILYMSNIAFLIVVLILFRGTVIFSQEEVVGSASGSPGNQQNSRGRDKPALLTEISTSLLFPLATARFNEIVYDLSGLPDRNNTEYLSRLRWEVMPLILPGVELDIKYNHGSRFSLAISGMGFLEKVGEMNNHDWGYTDRDWSDWSQHDISLNWALVGRIEHQWAIYRSAAFSLRGGLGYNIDWWSWGSKVKKSVYTTLEGPGKYPREYSEGQSYRDVHDMVTPAMGTINYEAVYHIPFAVLSADVEIGKVVFYSVFAIGPVFAFGTDEHIAYSGNGEAWKIVFSDTVMWGGPWISVSARVFFRLSRKLVFSPGVEYSLFYESRGDSVENSMGRKSNKSGSAGMAFDKFVLSAALKWIY